MGEHVNLSYLRPTPTSGTCRSCGAPASDRRPTLLAPWSGWRPSPPAPARAGPPAALRRPARAGRRRRSLGRDRAARPASPGVRYSEKRWRRIRPPLSCSPATFAARCAAATGRATRPAGPTGTSPRGRWTGSAAASPAPGAAGYPLWREHAAGVDPARRLAHAAAGAPAERHRRRLRDLAGLGERAGAGAAATSRTPELDAVLKREAAYFPWVQSHGFPSVEGATGSSSARLARPPRRSSSPTSCTSGRAASRRSCAPRATAARRCGRRPGLRRLRRRGSSAGTTPSSTTRARHDGLLVDRFLERYDELARGGEAPVHALLWTVCTHPPFDLPERRRLLEPEGHRRPLRAGRRLRAARSRG